MEKYRIEVAGKAARAAREKADVITSSLGAKVGKVLSSVEEQSQPTFVPYSSTCTTSERM
jgi:uncharacterized protein YggE